MGCCLCCCNRNSNEPPQQQQQNNGDSDCMLCLKRWYGWMLGGAGCGIFIGVVFLIIGIVYIVTGEPSTIKKEYEKRVTNWDEVEVPDLAQTSITAPVNVGSSLLPTGTWRIGSEIVTWNDQGFDFTVPRPTSGNSLDLSVTVRMNFALTSQTFTSTIDFASIPLAVNGAALNTACVVIKRVDARNSEWLLGDEASCFFPFTAEAQQYSNPASATIRVMVRSAFDPYLYLQEQGEGNQNVENKDVLVVNPNTPTFFAIGAIFLIGGIVSIFLLCCCLRPIVERDGSHQSA